MPNNDDLGLWSHMLQPSCPLVVVNLQQFVDSNEGALNRTEDLNVEVNSTWVTLRQVCSSAQTTAGTNVTLAHFNQTIM